MDTKALTANTAAAVVGGIAGSKAMSPVTTKMYEMESKQDKQREKQASKGGSAPTVAAEKAANAAGVELGKQEKQQAGKLMHYLTGIAAGPLYVWLRRRRHMGPLAAGLASGMALFVVVDEVANPLLGTSGPPQAYPMSTHVRGLVGHAVFGLGLAAAAEAVLGVLGERPHAQ
jgi:hypothetical protein